MLTLLTAYSGFLISRLVHAVSGAVLFGDIGEAAAGSKVRYTRCTKHVCMLAWHGTAVPAVMTLPSKA